VTATQRKHESSYADLSEGSTDPRAAVRQAPQLQVPDRQASDRQPRPTEVPPMWRRLAARAIDMIAVATWIFTFSIAHIFLHLQLWSNDVAPQPWGNWFLTTVTFFVCYAAYEIVFVAKAGATPGKDFMGIEVVDATTGGRPTLDQATRRWLLPGIVQPIPGAWIGAILTGVWGATGFLDPQRRTVHDRLAGTRIVSKAPPGSDEAREDRRRSFTPRLIDPLAVFRAARDRDPAALKRHPAGDQ
jgi:uncharacterized RDD family membrane protein YckC